MKNRRILPLIILFAAVCVCILLVWVFPAGKRPFQDLKSEDISHVTVELTPPQIRLAVSEEELSELVDILNRVVIYEKDDTEYAGQSVHFIIEKSDGTQTDITACNPVLIIDGVGYRTKYGPCEDLNRLAYNLDSGKEGD